MPEKRKFIVTVSDNPNDGAPRVERIDLENTPENREALRAYQRDPSRENLRRLIGPTEALFKDGWVLTPRPD